MNVRFICKTHGVPLENCGNGRCFFPTATAEPIVDKDGWREFDMSEFCCPIGTKEEEEGLEPSCDFQIETAVPEVRISDQTVLTDKGWNYIPSPDRTEDRSQAKPGDGEDKG